MFPRIAIALLVAAPAGVAITPRQAAAQVAELRVVSAEGAQRAIAAALAEARRQQWNVSIAVVDVTGTLVAFQRMDGAPAASVDLSIGKARTAARFRRTSKEMEELVARRPAFGAVEGLVPVEGAVPIVVNDVVVGAVGVSGVTSQQDAQVAAAGAGAVRGER